MTHQIQYSQMFCLDLFQLVEISHNGFYSPVKGAFNFFNILTEKLCSWKVLLSVFADDVTNITLLTILN